MEAAAPGTTSGPFWVLRHSLWLIAVVLGLGFLSFCAFGYIALRMKTRKAVIAFLSSVACAVVLFALIAATPKGHHSKHHLDGFVAIGCWLVVIVLAVLMNRDYLRWLRERGLQSNLARSLGPSAPASAELTPVDAARLAKIRLVFSSVVMLFILGMGIYGTVTSWHHRLLVQAVPGGLSATGHVVDLEVYHGKSTTYGAIVDFQTSDGRVQRFKGQFGSDKPQVGREVRVSYSPAHPADAHDLTDNTNAWKWPFFTSLFVTAVGVVAATFGVITLRRRRDETEGSVPPAPVDAARRRLMQTKGFLAGGIVVGGVAIAIGVTNHASWVIIPAALGVLASAGVSLSSRRRMTAPSETPEAFEHWFTKRGVWLMLAGGIPTYVAIGGAARALQRH